MPVSIVEKFLARVLHVLLVNGHIMYNFVIRVELWKWKDICQIRLHPFCF